MGEGWTMHLHSIGGEATGTTSRSVTRLARDARSAIEGRAGREEREAIIRRIDGLRSEWDAVPTAPIRLWLNNLRRQVELA